MPKVSIRKIKKRTRQKTNPLLVIILREATKNKYWREIAKILSSSSRRYSSVNLSQIDKQTTPGDTVIIPGKVLSEGDLTKKVRICSLSISKPAREKLKSTKSEYVTILEEIKKNQKAEGIKIIR